jgi:hypothetical protein
VQANSVNALAAFCGDAQFQNDPFKSLLCVVIPDFHENI